MRLEHMFFLPYPTVQFNCAESRGKNKNILRKEEKI